MAVTPSTGPEHTYPEGNAVSSYFSGKVPSWVLEDQGNTEKNQGVGPSQRAEGMKQKPRVMGVTLQRQMAEHTVSKDHSQALRSNKFY